MASSSSSPTSMPMPAEPLHWVKPAQQARSRKTQERLLDAVEDLVRETASTALTVSEIVARARSSVGAFYARFPDKDSLFAILHERSCTEAKATAALALDLERWRSTDLPTVITEVVRFTVEICRERRGLLLAFIGLAASDVSYARRRAVVERDIAKRMGALLAHRTGEFSHPDPELASRFCVRMILSTLEYGALIVRGEPADHTLSDERMARELSRAILAYLGIAESRGRVRTSDADD